MLIRIKSSGTLSESCVYMIAFIEFEEMFRESEEMYAYTNYRVMKLCEISD